MTDREPAAAIVTIGNFDGVHLGHQYMLGQVVDRARALGLSSFAVTFDPDPQEVLYPERPHRTLTAPAEKVELMRKVGIDRVWVCPFTLELSRLEPEQFLEMVSDRQPMAELWVGSDFAMGRDRSGTVGVLAALGAKQGWGLHVVPPFRMNGAVVSSTQIRALLERGDAEGAEALLGRRWTEAAVS